MCPQQYIWGRPIVLHRAWSFARWRTTPRALGNPSLSRAGGKFHGGGPAGLGRGGVGGWVGARQALSRNPPSRPGARFAGQDGVPHANLGANGKPWRVKHTPRAQHAGPRDLARCWRAMRLLDAVIAPYAQDARPRRFPAPPPCCAGFFQAGATAHPRPSILNSRLTPAPQPASRATPPQPSSSPD